MSAVATDMVNREERNYAAIFYYVLLTQDNLARFLDVIQCDFPHNPDGTAAYLEYAYLRDVWDATGLSNEAKRRIIVELLGTPDVQALEGASVLEWNGHFVVGTPVASSVAV